MDRAMIEEIARNVAGRFLSQVYYIMNNQNLGLPLLDVLVDEQPEEIRSDVRIIAHHLVENDWRYKLAISPEKFIMSW